MSIVQEMPNAADLEIAVLGAILLESDVMEKVAPFLSPKSFFHEFHEKMYKACEQLYYQKNPVDMLTVSNQMKKNGDIRSSNDLYYISTVTSKVAGTSSAQFHAAVLAEKYLHRKLIEIGHNAVVAGYDETKDIFDSLHKIQQDIKRLEDNIRKNEREKSTESVVKEILSDVKNNVVEKGHSTGIKALDKELHGLMKGAVIVVGGRPGMGKTSFIKRVAIQNAVYDNKKVKIWSLEMTPKQLLIDILGQLTKIDTTRIRNKNLTDQEKKDLNDAAAKIKNNLQIFGKGSTTISSIKREIEKDPPDIAMLDYIQIMSHDPNDGKGLTRDGQLSIVLNCIAQTAKDSETSFIVLSQLSKEVEKRNPPKPVMGDLKDSGAIEANALQILLLYRPEYYSGKDAMENGVSLAGKIEFIIAKNRFGNVTSVKGKFVKEYTSFEDLDETELNQPPQAIMPEIPGLTF